jgi:hypothetical protein
MNVDVSLPAVLLACRCADEATFSLGALSARRPRETERPSESAGTEGIIFTARSKERGIFLAGRKCSEAEVRGASEREGHPQREKLGERRTTRRKVDRRLRET